ncbi:MAG: roadblock/LC7 domain-containing protein [Candidatus Helarchaeota archaeon]
MAIGHQRTILILKQTGECLFQYGIEKDGKSDLISGLMSAILSFSQELIGEKLDHLKFKSTLFNLKMKDGLIFIISSVLDDREEDTKELLDTISKKFLARYEKELKEWNGKTEQFDDFLEDLQVIFTNKKKEERMSRIESLKKVLLDIEKNSSVTDSIIVTRDGFPVANTIKGNKNVNQAAAMVASLTSLSRRILDSLEGGKDKRILINGEKEFVLAMRIELQQPLNIICIGPEDESIGLVLYQVESAVNEIKKIMGDN